MIRFHKTPWVVRAWYPNLIWSLPEKESIYLTFDDGPNPNVTPWVMRELENFQAKATFFCLGKNLNKNQDIAKELLTAGHTIGNHTYSHLNGWRTNDPDFQEDVRKCDLELMKIGADNLLFRPPYGRIKKSQITSLENRKLIMWSHLSWDFSKELNVKKCLKSLKKANSGSILVFHDSTKAYKNLRIILPEILSYFNSKGWKFEALT